MVKAELLKQSRNFSLYVLKIDNRFPVKEYISGLSDSGQKHIFALFDLVLEKGPPKNKEKFRSIGDKIYELKTPIGSRILCFFGGTIFPNSLILTHGFDKPKRRQLNREKSKAVKWMRELAREGKEIKDSNGGGHHANKRGMVQGKIRLLQGRSRIPT